MCLLDSAGGEESVYLKLRINQHFTLHPSPSSRRQTRGVKAKGTRSGLGSGQVMAVTGERRRKGRKELIMTAELQWDPIMAANANEAQPASYVRNVLH